MAYGAATQSNRVNPKDITNMPKVVGVRFGQATKVYDFDPSGFDSVIAGDYVIVDTARGRELGKITSAPHIVPQEEIVGNLKSVLRHATPWDLVQSEAFSHKEKDALDVCKEKVAEQRLSMKLVRAEYSFDGSRLTFFFTAEKRVDFRTLVRELAKTFKTRIELRQIGVRDEAKLIGGVGHCGRPLCCHSWLCDFNPVSIKMAKQQNLPLNPMEISGICGRLLCCLSYENDFYVEAKRRLSKVGKIIDTPQGKARVVSLNIFSETMKVELENAVLVEMKLDEASGQLVKIEPEPSLTSLEEIVVERDAPPKQPAANRSEEQSKRKRNRSESSRSRRNRSRRKKSRGGKRDHGEQSTSTS
jgi:cell fate regulator YaaT (PSP1 superfamily)